MSSKRRTFTNRSEFLSATSARFSALCSWTHQLLGVDHSASERIVIRALAMRPGFIIGGAKPLLFDEVIRQASADLAHEQSELSDEDAAREAVREDVQEIIG